MVERERHFAEEVSRSTTRLSQEVVTGVVASLLAQVEQTMTPGQEMSHLRSLLRSASYRGTDVRFMFDVDESMPEVPYLALRWQWKTWKTVAFPWQQDGHINELELNTLRSF